MGMAATWRTLLLLLCCAILRSEGSCFGRDASFTPGAKPVVTQPSRNDPSKVMVDWSKIVKNAQCVDKFVVWMWPDGTGREGNDWEQKILWGATLQNCWAGQGVKIECQRLHRGLPLGPS